MTFTGTAFSQVYQRPTNGEVRPRVVKTVSTRVVGARSFKSTGYCLSGRTASGIPARRGVIAVDPRVIPLKSRVEIKGKGIFIAADTGRLIKGNIIDIHMSCTEAIKWGRRDVMVKIL